VKAHWPLLLLLPPSNGMRRRMNEEADEGERMLVAVPMGREIGGWERRGDRGR